MGLEITTTIEEWPLKEPFRITGFTFEVIRVLVVTIAKDGHVGRGEALVLLPQRCANLMQSHVRSIEAK